MLRPFGDYILVQMDPPKVEGLIVTVHGPRLRTGEVRALGPGRLTRRGRRAHIDLVRGERVAFFREHLEHLQGKAVVRSLAELGDGLALLRASDVLFVVPPGWKGQLS